MMITSKNLKLMSVCFGIAVLVGFFLFIRIMFGTYSVPEAILIYNNIVALEKKYQGMFAKRENLMYHIGWAESRGEHTEVKRMSKDLEALDDDIDNVEREMKLWKEGGRKRLGKEHAL